MLRTIRTNVDLVEINILIAYLPPEKYIQHASLSHDGKRRFIRKGSAGGKSISAKNVTILASGIDYLI